MRPLKSRSKSTSSPPGDEWVDFAERQERLARIKPPIAPPVHVPAQRRKELADMLRSLVAHIETPARKPGFERPRSPSEAEVSRRHHEARLADLAASSAKPLRISDELRRQFPQEPEVEL